MKTLWRGIQARVSGLKLYSTNILNRDGEVLDDPEAFKSRKSRDGRLDYIVCSRIFTLTLRKLDTSRAQQYYPRRRHKEGLGQHRHHRVWMGYRGRSRRTFSAEIRSGAPLCSISLCSLIGSSWHEGRSKMALFYWNRPQTPPAVFIQSTDIFIQ
jgi:hypothetical protein